MKNLRRKIREELNKTLLNEDTVCPRSVWMSCGEFIRGCNAPFSGIYQNQCVYRNCCPGNGWDDSRGGSGGEGPYTEPTGTTMGESRR